MDLTSYMMHMHYCENNIEALVSLFDEQFSWFGAGEEEHAVGTETVTQIFRQFAGKVPRCNITDEHYYVLRISPDAYLCTGLMWISTDPSTNVYLRVHQRVTMGFRWVDDRARCFHPFKGMFAVLVGVLPFLLFTGVYACLARPVSYSLGVLPSWTEALMRQSEFADALSYYNRSAGLGVMDILRVIDRAMMMPFINVFSSLGNEASLLAERLSPLFVLIAPLGYGLGYAQGKRLRDRINTGIKMGDDKKKRRERKARRQRQRSKSPERLI